MFSFHKPTSSLSSSSISASSLNGDQSSHQPPGIVIEIADSVTPSNRLSHQPNNSSMPIVVNQDSSDMVEIDPKPSVVSFQELESFLEGWDTSKDDIEAVKMINQVCFNPSIQIDEMPLSLYLILMQIVSSEERSVELRSRSMRVLGNFLIELDKVGKIKTQIPEILFSNSFLNPAVYRALATSSYSDEVGNLKKNTFRFLIKMITLSDPSVSNHAFKQSFQEPGFLKLCFQCLQKNNQELASHSAKM